MKNNILFGLSTIIIAISIAYYFVYYLPSNKKVESLFSKKQYCEQLGNKYFLQEKEQKTHSENGVFSLTGKAQYIYSKILNTCLYNNTISTITTDINKTEYFIIDLNTNNEIAGYTHWERGCDGCSIYPENLDQQKKYYELYKQNF